jgi:hypothetical protein
MSVLLVGAAARERSRAAGPASRFPCKKVNGRHLIQVIREITAAP